MTRQQNKKEKNSKMKIHDTKKGADGGYRLASDLPISELKRKSAQAGKLANVPFDVMPKFTCINCGERNFAGEPNQWPESVTCKACGFPQPFLRGGFAMRYRFNETPENKHLQPKVLIGLPNDMARSDADGSRNAKAVCDAFGVDIEGATPISQAEMAEVAEAIRQAEGKANA